MIVKKFGEVIVGEDYIHVNGWTVSGGSSEQLKRSAMWRAVRKLLYELLIN